MPAIPTSTSVATWNRATKHVEAQIRSGRYVNGETTLIVAGPPRLADMANVAFQNGVLTGVELGDANSAGRDALYPIGLIESCSVQQVQNVQKMYEIGSRRSYQAGGRVQVVGTLGRVMFNGPSLMRALYAYYPSSIQMANGKVLGDGSGVKDTVRDVVVPAGKGVFPDVYFEPGSFSAADPESASKLPNSFFVNLMSELFSHPFGLGLIIRDNNNKNYGAVFMEDCFLTAHSFQISATSTLITEVVNFQADACVPLEFSTEAGAQLAALLAATAPNQG